MSSNPSTPGKILGIGGVFFKSADKPALESWYRERLGIDIVPDQGALFHWRSNDGSDKEHLTVLSIFSDKSKYFDPSKASFMINYIVDDLDAFLAKLEASGVQIDPKRDDYDYGRFAWIYDGDGNKIELWQPL
jgi:predicted enzyme related to lactoylglutathione lyase